MSFPDHNTPDSSHPAPGTDEQKAALNAGISTKIRTTPTPTPTPMEVHTHGHVHEDKKWKEYLFQFLMLFLAVTAGFFMENQREEYVEHHRAKTMAMSLIEDLKADTTEITSSSKRLTLISKSADSLMLQLDKPRQMQNDSAMQVYLGRMMGYNYFDPQTGTYQQIKSSGALRYFRPTISLKLTNYETSTNYINKLSLDCMDFREHVIVPYLMDVLNPKLIRAVREKTAFNGPYFLEEPTPAQLRKIYNMAYLIRSIYNWYNDRCAGHRKLAVEQIQLLRQEYGR